MCIRTQGAVSTARNVLSMAASFCSFAAQARRKAGQVAQVTQVCTGWRVHFAPLGVGAADLGQLLGRSIDRPALVGERAALL